MVAMAASPQADSDTKGQFSLRDDLDGEAALAAVLLEHGAGADEARRLPAPPCFPF